MLYGSDVHRQHISQLDIVKILDGIVITYAQLVERASSNNILISSLTSYKLDVHRQ